MHQKTDLEIYKKSWSSIALRRIFEKKKTDFDFSEKFWSSIDYFGKTVFDFLKNTWSYFVFFDPKVMKNRKENF